MSLGNWGGNRKKETEQAVILQSLIFSLVAENQKITIFSF